MGKLTFKRLVAVLAVVAVLGVGIGVGLGIIGTFGGGSPATAASNGYLLECGYTKWEGDNVNDLDCIIINTNTGNWRTFQMDQDSGTGSLSMP